jgi:methionyl-tRNA synthetase
VDSRRWARAGATRCGSTTLDGYLLHDALSELWELVGGANKTVDAEQPWVLAKAAKAGDAVAATRLRDVLGDLVETCRLVGLAVAPFMPSVAPRMLARWVEWYGEDGNEGRDPDLLEGALRDEPGRVTAAPEPLFPRLDVETAEAGTD